MKDYLTLETIVDFPSSDQPKGAFGKVTPAILMHGFSWEKWITGKPMERLTLILAEQEHILEQ